MERPREARMNCNTMLRCFEPQGLSKCGCSNKEPSSSGSVLTPNSSARSPAPRKARESRGGKEAADAARFEAAEALGLPVKDGRVEYPDAQLEYSDIEGRSGRVNVEIATEHYSVKSIGAKAAAGFAVHGSNGRAAARVARALGQDHSTGGGGGSGGRRDKGSIEL